MSEKKGGRDAWRFLLPLAFAAPFLAALILGVCIYGQTIRNALEIAVKMVVIP